MKIITRSKIIGLFLTAFFLFGGVQQQIKGMEVDPEQITIVLKDGETSVAENLLQYSKTIKDMLDDSKKGVEIDLGIFDITKKQWGVIEKLLKLVKSEQELQNIIQKLTLEQLVELSNNVTSLDIKSILEESIKYIVCKLLSCINLAEPTHQDMILNNNLQELNSDLRKMVKKEFMKKLDLASKKAMGIIFGETTTQNLSTTQCMSSYEDGMKITWNTKDGKVITYISGSSNPYKKVITYRFGSLHMKSPDDNKIAIVYFERRVIKICNMVNANNSLLKTIELLDSEIYSIEWSIDSSKFIITYTDGNEYSCIV